MSTDFGRLKNRMQIHDLRTKDIVPGFSANKDLREDCSNIIGKNISLISSSFNPFEHEKKYELEDLVTYANELLSKDYTVIDTEEDLIGEYGGLNSKMLVLGFNKKENKFFVDNAETDEESIHYEQNLRHYILKAA